MGWIGTALGRIGKVAWALIAFALFWLFQAAVYVGLFLGWMLVFKYALRAIGVGDGGMVVAIGGAVVLTIACVIGLERIAARHGWKGLFEPMPF